MTYTFTQEDFCCSHCDENLRSTLIGAVLKSNNVWAMSIPVAYTVSWKSRNAFHTRIHIKRKCHAMWWLFSDDNSKRFQLPYFIYLFLTKTRKTITKRERIIQLVHLMTHYQNVSENLINFFSLSIGKYLISSCCSTHN